MESTIFPKRIQPLGLSVNEYNLFFPQIFSFDK